MRPASIRCKRANVQKCWHSLRFGSVRSDCVNLTRSRNGHSPDQLSKFGRRIPEGCESIILRITLPSIRAFLSLIVALTSASLVLSIVKPVKVSIRMSAVLKAKKRLSLGVIVRLQSVGGKYSEDWSRGKILCCGDNCDYLGRHVAGKKRSSDGCFFRFIFLGGEQMMKSRGWSGSSADL